VVLAVLWAVIGYQLTRQPDFHDYRKAAVQAAESAYDAVATAQLTVQAQLDGQVTGAYTDSTLQRGADAVAGAWKQYATAQPVDARSVSIRDELGPLLQESVRVLGDLRYAEQLGPAATAHALAAAGPLAEDLSDFVDRHR
jgi:hypothetical protein